MPHSLGAPNAALRADVGHETYPDPAFGQRPWGDRINWDVQFLLATSADVSAMRGAIDLAKASSRQSGTVDVAGVMNALAPIINAHSIPTAGGPDPGGTHPRRGNSQQDLLLTTMGWAFGELVREDAFKTTADAAAWLERNLGAETPPAPPTGQTQAPASGGD